jgi:hypothetical protein
LFLVLCLHGGTYPQYILNGANELNNDNHIKTEFYSLYNTILNYWFPSTEGYAICPRWQIPNSTKIEDLTITFVIKHHQHPFLLMEIKPPSDFQLDSGRAAAIVQVINCLDEIGPNNLHAD